MGNTQIEIRKSQEQVGFQRHVVIRAAFSLLLMVKTAQCSEWGTICEKGTMLKVNLKFLGPIKLEQEPDRGVETDASGSRKVNSKC